MPAETTKSPIDTSALLLFAHGSSEPAWAEPFRQLQTIMQAREPGRIIELAFLERMNPDFDAAIAALEKRGVRKITVAPIFLAIGGHMKNDLPGLVSVAASRTGIEFRILPALGEVDTLLEAIAAWVLAA
ncbi:MAG: CbiX/SirB N-terminal domain-containing protein [Betaproteobacteria bacterium]